MVFFSSDKLRALHALTHSLQRGAGEQAGQRGRGPVRPRPRAVVNACPSNRLSVGLAGALASLERIQ